MDTDKHKQLLETAINRMHSASSAFFIWKWLGIAINVHGGKELAEKNVEIMSTYRFFFQPIRISVYKSFVADLSIFFDSNKYDAAFSMEKLLGIVKDKLSVSDFENLKEKINEIKKKHGVKISFIQELRNADVAHQEIRSQSRIINYAQIEELFAAVQEIINLIENAYDKSIHIWDHIEKDTSWHMQWVFDNLDRGERARLKAINKKYKRSLSRIKKRQGQTTSSK